MTVDRLNIRTQDWHITMNRHDGDNDKIQVFITSLNNDDVEIVEYVPLNQVDSLVKRVTGLGVDQLSGDA